jgi:hypothetical protein
MTWLAWRSQRLQLLVCVGVVALVAIGLAITGADYRSALIASNHACRLASSPACSLADLHLASAGHWSASGPYVLAILPAALGLVLGTPIVAREIEQGTNRLAWTQSIGRTRWLAIKLCVAGLVVAAALAALDPLLAWWHVAEARGPEILPGSFSITGFVDVGYALFAFMLGAALGSLIRRTGWAMTAGVPLFVIFRTFAIDLLPHLAPVVTTRAGGPTEVSGSANSLAYTLNFNGGWTINSGYVPNGRSSPGPGQNWDTGFDELGSSLKRCVDSSGQITQSSWNRCAENLKLHYVTQYQPWSHYWALQIAETAVLVGAALLLCALTVVAVRRWRT